MATTTGTGTTLLHRRGSIDGAAMYRKWHWHYEHGWHNRLRLLNDTAPDCRTIMVALSRDNTLHDFAAFHNSALLQPLNRVQEALVALRDLPRGD